MIVFPFISSKNCLYGLKFISLLKVWSSLTGNLLVQRQAAQCVGRVIRSKADYGMMIFADKRFVFLCSLLSLEFPNSG